MNNKTTEVMEMKEFIEKIAEAIEVEDVSVLSADTKFRDLDEWSSLAGLSVITMFDDDFDTELTVAEFRQAVTIGDLFKLLKK